METIQSKKYSEDEVDDMIEEYKAKFGGQEKWKHVGETKFVAVKGTAVEFNRVQGQLFLSGNMNTASTMMSILEVKKLVKKERELMMYALPMPKNTCLHGCCHYESE